MRNKVRWWQYLIAIFLVFVFLLPVVYIIATSFKPYSEIFTAQPKFFPTIYTFENYIQAYERRTFFRFI